MAMSYGVTLLDTNGVRGLLLSLCVIIGLARGTQPALATTCAQQTAAELERGGDVAATGAVDSYVPLGFIFAADHVYKGQVPGHVLVLGQYRPPDQGTHLFLVMRFHLPGVYSMDVCDGRPLVDTSLGRLGDASAPAPDLPLPPAAVGAIIGLALLVGRRGPGKPSAPATASAY